MFTDVWIILSLLISFLGLITGQGNLLTVAALLLTVASTSWLWSIFALNGVKYQRTFSEVRAFVGETVDLTLSITNRKLLPVAWLRVDDLFPERVPIVGRELSPSSIPLRGLLISLASLRWYERVSWRYQLKCQRRGFYFFGPARLRSGDGFGLFSREAQMERIDRLIIYPRVLALPELGFPGKQPFGEKKAPQPIFEDPSRTIGVRQYRPKDGFRRIHWKATARHQELQVKVYEPTHTYYLFVFLNVATYEQHWLGIDRELQDFAISVAASIAFHATEHRYSVGLVANGSVPQSDQPIKVLPSRDPDQLRHILEALAAVTSFATGSIEKLLASESPRVPWGATLVVVTAVVSEALLAEMARLRAVGRKLVLVSLDDDYTDGDLPGITVHHIPVQEMLFRWVRSQRGTEEQVNEWLSQRGGHQ